MTLSVKWPNTFRRISAGSPQRCKSSPLPAIWIQERHGHQFHAGVPGTVHMAQAATQIY